MKRPHPSNDEIRAAMDQVLTEAEASGRRPTSAAVERCLGIPHATFYRNHVDLIRDYFQPRATKLGRPVAAARAVPTPDDDGESGKDIQRRLRSEIDDLRKTVALYEAAIRQLTLEIHELRTQLAHTGTVTHLRPTSHT